MASVFAIIMNVVMQIEQAGARGRVSSENG